MGYPELVIAAGASSYWRLGETSGPAIDLVGGKNGTLSGGVSRVQPGPVDKAMRLDGATGKIVTAAIAIPSTCTIEVWLKAVNMPDWGAYFSNRDSASPTEFMLGFMGHKPFLFSSTGNPSTVTGTTVIDDGRWHHVVFAFTPTNVTIYVDGVTNGTFPLTLAVASANPLGIGFDDGDTPLYFPGSLAEVALYPTALVAQELAAHVQTAMFPFPGGPPPGYSNARAIR